VNERLRLQIKKIIEGHARAALVLIFLCIGISAHGQDKPSSRGTKLIEKPNQLRPAMLVWANDQDADRLVETVTQAMLGDRQVWRVTDYDQDPTSTTANDYDLYDLDAVTLSPLRSISNREGSQLQLTFGDHEVTVRTKAGGTESAPERIAVSVPVKPEGPGETAMVASLPLAIGYRTQYQIVDRWDGHGSARLKTVTLSVQGDRLRPRRLEGKRFMRY
jgi:hypothetical protein